MKKVFVVLKGVDVFGNDTVLDKIFAKDEDAVNYCNEKNIAKFKQKPNDCYDHNYELITPEKYCALVAECAEWNCVPYGYYACFEVEVE